MKLFAVFKQGIHRHECGGVFSTLELAREAAMKLIAGEPDDYHRYEVVPFELDDVTPQRPNGNPPSVSDWWNLTEPAVMLTLTRKGNEVFEK